MTHNGTKQALELSGESMISAQHWREWIADVVDQRREVFPEIPTR